MPAKFEDAFRANLAAQGFAVGARVSFWEAKEQVTTPYAVFMPVGELVRVNHDGPIDVVEREWQVTVFSPSQSAAEAGGREIRQYLAGFSGKMENVDVRAFIPTGATGGRDPETKYFAVSHTYRVMYHETTTPYA